MPARPQLQASPIVIDSDLQEEKDVVEYLVVYFTKVFTEVRQKLQQYDEATKKWHDKYADLVDFDLRPGDLVLK